MALRRVVGKASAEEWISLDSQTKCQGYGANPRHKNGNQLYSLTKLMYIYMRDASIIGLQDDKDVS
jgi:hypothetical protein